jgi:hypothetical protein
MLAEQRRRARDIARGIRSYANMAPTAHSTYKARFWR